MSFTTRIAPHIDSKRFIVFDTDTPKTGVIVRELLVPENELFLGLPDLLYEDSNGKLLPETLRQLKRLNDQT